ncbi:MAG: hypothetical protein Kapaf2KO_17630 [Candidatus Kapaibacteriales bacterium]
MEHSGLALPVGGAHLELLNFLLMVAMVIVLVFSAYLSGALMISVSKKKAFEKKGDKNYYGLAKDMIAHIADYPIIWFACGVVPYLAMILAFVQLFSGQEANIVILLLSFGFVAMLGALGMGWVYKETLKRGWVTLNTDMSAFKAEAAKDELTKSTLLSSNYGGWAVLFILTSIWLTVSGIVMAYNPEWWESGVNVTLFSWGTQIKFSLLTIGGVALAAVGFLYLKFNANDPSELGDKSYQELAKFEASRLAMWFTLYTPVLIGLSIATVPLEASSLWMYGLVAVAFVLLAIAGHFNYAILKTGQSNYAIGSYWLLLFVFIFIATAEHQAFSEVNQENRTHLAHEYEIMEAEIIAARSEIPEIVIDGEQVFTQKCSSCHRFDQQLVGPAYNNVVPKYYEDQATLIKFILNPYPVNPAQYPAGMANPGLNPAEAQAVSDYLIGAVKTNLGDASGEEVTEEGAEGETEGEEGAVANEEGAEETEAENQ